MKYVALAVPRCTCSSTSTEVRSTPLQVLAAGHNRPCRSTSSGWAVLLSYSLFYAYRKRVEDKRTTPAEGMVAAGTPAPIAGASDP